VRVRTNQRPQTKWILASAGTLADFANDLQVNPFTLDGRCSLNGEI
jgi:hypothetical protein